MFFSFKLIHFRSRSAYLSTEGGMSTNPFVVQIVERSDQVAICNKMKFSFPARGVAVCSVPNGRDLTQEMDQGVGVFFLK